jgi:hypothetical protein
MNDIPEKIIVGPFEGVWESLIHFLPKLLSAFAIFLVGVIVAIIFRFIFAGVLRIFGVDRFLEKSGTSEVMRKGGLKNPASVLIARFLAWVIVVIFAIISMRVLDVITVRKLLEDLLLYLPNVFTGVLVLLFGYLLSNFIGRAILISSVNAGIRAAGLIGRFVKYVIFALAVTMAIEQLGIGSNTATLAFAIVLGGIVLALALAFGLGGRDMAKEYLENLMKKKVPGEGDRDDNIRHL